ncbi:MAG TPA: ATP-dependent protease subunit HslV [Candidatus Rifleibacterium sp.]|mgnify:FL=1|nr:ATP-dependent protease subunit HslV [Candidatus Rifleibacterium sp.]HQB81987.1 ATP-dependent protease subunit HslV [Candidatus Rifleibacterium sp.]
MTYHGTTILAVIRDGKLAFGGDGQVTLGDQIVKARAQKIRRLGSHPIIGGFAGATADAFTLFERFENKLDSMSGNMTRAAVELARDWRMDKALRQLQAMLLVGNSEKILVLSGQGDVLEPDEPVAAIGSGGPAALAAAKAMLRHTDLSAAEIVKNALIIASEQCIYTNDKIIVEVMPS